MASLSKIEERLSFSLNGHIEYEKHITFSFSNSSRHELSSGGSPKAGNQIPVSQQSQVQFQTVQT